MHTHSLLHRIFTTLVIVGLLGGTVQPIAHAQSNTPQQGTTHTYLPSISDIRASGDELLFRTFVTVRNPVQWRDLERINPVFLDRGDDWALLLVDDLQLADLARLRYNPEQTNGLTALVAANAARDSVGAASLQPLVAQARVYASRSRDDVLVAEANARDVAICTPCAGRRPTGVFGDCRQCRW